MTSSKTRLAAILAASAALTACHSSSSGGGGQPPATGGTYEATLTGVEITRPADGQSMAVSGLPAKGAQLTVP